MAHILLVDDDPSVHRKVGALLNELGYTVEHATDSEVALLCLSEEGPFDLIVCDNNMRFTNEGLEFGASLYLKSNPTPFILHTSAELREVQHTITQYKMHYVQKSSASETLFAKIAEILEHKSATL